MTAQRGGAESPQSGRTVGQYKILDLIGSGGMGDVYRAHDGNLKRTVAVKVLSDRLMRKQVAVQRFIREAQVACKIIHPYVATVFDVLKEGDELFLVMELIEGQRLSTILRSQEVELQDKLRWATEITEALCAIHKSGLIHRDIKPGNVMITPEGHAKVMDFGLARPSDDAVDAGMTTTASDITQEGMGVGTVLYMSPEQLRAQPVDRRSDLFSLGIVLYELLSGSHPFRKATSHESVSAILNEAPGGGRDPQSLSETGPLRDMVLRLLEKDPDRRYQSGEEVLRELQSLLQPGRRIYEVRAAVSLPRRIAVAATLVLLVVAAVLTARWLNRPPPTADPRLSVALVPFVDRTGEEQGPVLARMVADFLSIELGASRLVRSVGPRETAPLLAGLDPESTVESIAGRLALGMSVDYVVVGTLYREGDRYLASVRLASIGTPAADLPEVRGSGASIAELADDLGAGLRRNLPDVSTITAWRDDRTRVTDLTSESGEANLLYERGVLALREERFADAIDHLTRSTEIDPGFALAHIRLAEALHTVGYGRRARDSAERALSLIPEGRSLTVARLELIIRAARAEIFGRTSDAVELSGRLVAMFPDDPVLLFRDAVALEQSGEFDAGIQRIERSLKLDPLNAAAHLQRARLLRGTREFEAATTALDEAGRLFELVRSREGQGRVAYERGRLGVAQEQLDLAERRYAEALRIHRETEAGVLAAGALHGLADVALLRGDAGAAFGHLEAAAATAREAGNLGLGCKILGSHGAQRFLAGDYAEAELLLREAVDGARRLENDLLLIHPLSNLGSLLSYTGRLDDARVELRSSVEVARRLERKGNELQALRQLADVDYQLGDLDAAIEGHRQVLASTAGDELDRQRAWSQIYLAEVLERRGNLEPALTATTDAIDRATPRALRAAEGYARARRSQVLSALGRLQQAVDDLERAQAIATGSETALDDLGARCLVARGVARGFSGDWAGAVELAEEARRHPGGEAPAVAAAALSLACEGLIVDGRNERAVERCSAAAGNDAAPLAERVIARALLGEAWLDSGNSDLAASEAASAYEAARTMGLLLPLARAASVRLRAAPPASPSERAALVHAGLGALEAYVASAPVDDRESLRTREDIRRIRTSLEEIEVESAPGPATSQQRRRS